MTFQFSQRSLSNLEGVDHRLQYIAKAALSISTVDFGVSQGLRTLDQQRAMFQRGASQTMDSKHLKGLAIDVFAYVDGSARWELEYYFDIADAFREAAINYSTPIRWGAAWNVHDLRKMKARLAYNHYVDTRENENRRPFIDAPHFELM